MGVPGGFAGNTLPRAGLFGGEAWNRGPYFGVASIGYSRPDERIREDIREEMTRR